MNHASAHGAGAPARTAEPGHVPRLLITAGPTHEPIDAVRYLANRSSGRLGVALADAAARRGWRVTLLLGPAPRRPDDTRVTLLGFRTTADLQTLLETHAPRCDVLVMAAAVADYRPKHADHATPPDADPAEHKLRRRGSDLVLELEPTPDLLAAAAAQKRPDQLFVGFALEPAQDLIASARRKLRRKAVDLVVANPLETMDADRIDATLVSPDAAEPLADDQGSPIPKTDFAEHLLDRLAPLAEHRINLRTKAAPTDA